MIGQLTNRFISWLKNREFRRVSKLNRFSPFELSFLGHKMLINDNVTFLHSRKEIFIDEAYKFRSDRRDPFILDCGANIGLSVLYFKKEFPGSQIIAFEPDPDLYKILLKNIHSFQLENIQAIEAACWTEEGTLGFQKEGAHSGSLTNFWDESRKIQVRSVNLGKYLNRTVDLLKMDIEGAEYEVLNGIRQSLRNVKNIVFEYHSSIQSDQKLADILSLLKEAGFRYHIKEAFTRSRPLFDKDVMLNMEMQLNIYGTRE